MNMIHNNIFLLIFIFLLNSDKLVCQYYYSYNYDNAFQDGFTEFLYQGDTVVNSEKYQKFEISGVKVAFFSQEDSVRSVYDEIFILSKRNEIFQYTYEFSYFNDLYRATETIGESWWVYDSRNTTFGVDSLKYVVVDTLSKLIDGENILGNCVDVFLSNGGFYFKDTIFSDLGSLTDYIDPFDFFERQVDGGIGGVPLCMKNRSMYYQYPENLLVDYFTVDLCGLDRPVSIYNSLESDNLNLFPNPLIEENNIYIKSNISHNGVIRIFNLFGEVEFSRSIKIVKGVNNLGISNLNKGCKIVYVDGEYIGKLIVY